MAVQGFGNVGSVAAAELENFGAKIVAISDVTGGIINKDGIDIKQLFKHFKESGSLIGYPFAKQCTNEEVLTCDCDILAPAATQSVVTSDIAGKIKAKIVAEGANSPTVPDADEILAQKNVFIIPDIMCNAGGVFVSYLEYTQETQREQMTLEQVNKRLNDRMNAKFEQVFEYSQGKQLKNASGCNGYSCEQSCRSDECIGCFAIRFMLA